MLKISARTGRGYNAGAPGHEKQQILHPPCGIRDDRVFVERVTVEDFLTIVRKILTIQVIPRERQRRGLWCFAHPSRLRAK
jgi:hypothetical protein